MSQSAHMGIFRIRFEARPDLDWDLSNAAEKRRSTCLRRAFNLHIMESREMVPS